MRLLLLLRFRFHLLLLARGEIRGKVDELAASRARSSTDTLRLSRKGEVFAIHAYPRGYIIFQMRLDFVPQGSVNF